MTTPGPPPGPISLRRPPRNAAARAERRGVALVIVLASISILTVLLAELQDEASSESAAQNVRHIDTLQYTNKLFRKLYSQGYSGGGQQRAGSAGLAVRPNRPPLAERTDSAGVR